MKKWARLKSEGGEGYKAGDATVGFVADAVLCIPLGVGVKVARGKRGGRKEKQAGGKKMKMVKNKTHGEDLGKMSKPVVTFNTHNELGDSAEGKKKIGGGRESRGHEEKTMNRWYNGVEREKKSKRSPSAKKSGESKEP